MAIAEHVLVEKGFAFVAMRGPLGDVSISFYGGDPPRPLQPRMPALQAEGLLMLDPLPA